MRTKNIILIFSLIFLTCTSCRKEKFPSENRLLISYSQTITNPPDDFLVFFNFNTFGEKSTEITFADSSNWLVEKIGDPRNTLSLFDQTGLNKIESADTLNAIPEFVYKIIVSNTYATDFLTFYVGFKKID